MNINHDELISIVEATRKKADALVFISKYSKDTDTSILKKHADNIHINADLIVDHLKAGADIDHLSKLAYSIDESRIAMNSIFPEPVMRAVIDRLQAHTPPVSVELSY